MKSLKYLIIVILVVVITSITVKAGDRFLGGVKKIDNDTCEEGMTRVESSAGGFCIDAYEASPGEDCYHLEVTNQLDTSSNLNKKECHPVSEPNSIPWRFISQDQARVACAKAGKRLATPKEWQQAVLGTPDVLGSAGNNDCHIDSNWNSQPGLTGTSQECVSSFGVYDGIGNLWEWVDGVVEDGVINGRELPSAGYVVGTDGKGLPGETSRKADINYSEDYLWIKNSGLRGIARGGYWKNKNKAGIYATYVVAKPSYAGEGIGFRCVK